MTMLFLNKRAALVASLIALSALPQSPALATEEQSPTTGQRLGALWESAGAYFDNDSNKGPWPGDRYQPLHFCSLFSLMPALHLLYSVVFSAKLPDSFGVLLGFFVGVIAGVVEVSVAGSCGYSRGEGLAAAAVTFCIAYLLVQIAWGCYEHWLLNRELEELEEKEASKSWYERMRDRFFGARAGEQNKEMEDAEEGFISHHWLGSTIASAALFVGLMVYAFGMPKIPQGGGVKDALLQEDTE